MAYSVSHFWKYRLVVELHKQDFEVPPPTEFTNLLLPTLKTEYQTPLHCSSNKHRYLTTLLDSHPVEHFKIGPKPFHSLEISQ